MAVSLRIVIGGITAITVLIVAALTLAITYTVSAAAVRDTGERLSEAISSTVSHEVRTFMARGENDVMALQRMGRVPNVTLPPDHPTYDTNEAWGDYWIAAIRSMSIRVNFTYSSMSVIFMDGSIIATLEHPLSRGFATEAVQTWRPATNTTRLTQFTWNLDTMASWDYATQGAPIRGVTTENAIGSALPVLGLAGYRDTCIWFPPGVDTTNVNGVPRYVLYGACVVYNGSNALLGTTNVGVYLDQLPSFLRGTSKTPNTHLVLVDSYRMLLGTTYDASYVEFGALGELRQRQNCVSSFDTSPPPIFVGCRSFAEDYPYPPLQDVMSVEPSFARAPGQNVRFGELGSENYYYISQRIPLQLNSYTINLITFMPESDVLGDIVAGRNLAIGITAAVFVIAVLVSSMLIGSLLSPIDDIARRMYFTSQLTSAEEQAHLINERSTAKSVEDFDDISHAELESAPMSQSALAEVRALQTAYATMDNAIKSFTKYVPRDVVKELMVNGQMCEIQMRPMRCSMLFTDIANFTSICERVPPPILSSLVQLYFERSSRTVMGHGGVIDKFIGDCIMAVWGAPVPTDHHEVRASVCGHMLVYETTQDPLRSRFAEAGENLAIRVGVSTGEVLAGNMGSEARMNYTVIGDDVNLASRLESLNKQWGTSVMVSEDTAEEISDYMALRYVISIAVVGKENPVRVYEVLGVDPAANTETLGAVTSDASEQVSLNQAKANQALVEMEQRYGSAGASRNDSVLSAGKLLRRALRKVVVTPEELRFAELYTAAIAHWNRGDFGACVQGLRGLANSEGVPTGCAERLSVVKVLAAAEENLRSPPQGGVWTGVWSTSEK